jgi:hypothetical protein
MTATEIENTLKESFDTLDKLFSPGMEPHIEDINGIVGYGSELSACAGLVAQTLTLSTQLLRMKELLFMNENQGLWEKPTLLKKLMETNLHQYYANVMLADRYSAALVHKLDFYRSLISKYKQEISMQ